jgi:chromosome partitioning protein
MIIAVTNQKGGVGKTTTVVNLATSLALSGRRILVVDLDPQGNATSGFGVDKSTVDRSMYEVLVDGLPIRSAVISTEVAGLSLIPSSIELSGAEVELVSADRRDRRLARALDGEVGDFDWVLVDGPPSLGLLTVNALTAADAVLIPIQCEYYALEGLTQLTATVNLVRDHLNPELEINGVVLTMYDARTNLSAEVASEVRRHLGPAVYDTVIPRSVRLSEAPSYGRPIALYRPDSRGAEAYAALAAEFVARAGSTTQPARHDRHPVQAGAA